MDRIVSGEPVLSDFLAVGGETDDSNLKIRRHLMLGRSRTHGEQNNGSTQFDAIMKYQQGMNISF
jgi:hypothetical protein